MQVDLSATEISGIKLNGANPNFVHVYREVALLCLTSCGINRRLAELKFNFNRKQSYRRAEYEDIEVMLG